MSQQYKTKCAHCGKVMRVDGSMSNLFQKCVSCQKTFQVLEMRKVKQKEKPLTQRFDTPLVQLGIKTGIAIGVIALVLVAGSFAIRNVGNVIYGAETAKYRKWYAGFEEGMPVGELTELLRTMPEFNEFAYEALVLPETMDKLSRSDWLREADSFEATSFGAPGDGLQDLFGSGSRMKNLDGKFLSTEISVPFDSGDDSGKYPGTYQLKSKTTDQHLEVEQQVYVEKYSSNIVAEEWHFKFRAKPEDEIGAQQLHLYFDRSAGAETATLARISKSGF